MRFSSLGGGSLGQHVAAEESTVFLKVRVHRAMWSVVLCDVMLQLPIDSHAPDETTLKKAGCPIWARIVRKVVARPVPWYGDVVLVFGWKNQPSLPFRREEAFERVTHLLPGWCKKQ